MKYSKAKLASRGLSRGTTRERGVTLLELLLVLAIVALVAYFACFKNGGSSSGPAQGSATLSAAVETIKVAAKNLTINMSPFADCSKATTLASDVSAAQAKIDKAAADYPVDYAANKQAIKQEIDKVNQGIQLYNHDCNSSIPQITLPP